MQTKLNSLLNRVDTRLAACAAAAGASVALPASSDAAIIWSGPVAINIPSTTAGVYLNVVTGVNSPTPAGAPGWDFNPWNAAGLSFFHNGVVASHGYINNFPGGTSATLVDNLAPGSPIGSTFGYTWSQNAASETTGITAISLNSSNNIFGFRFQNEANGNQIHFGWARISLVATSGGQPRAIVEYAYESVAGAAIPAGAIPEPSTFALLGVMAVGALGVRAWRKHKAA